MPTGHSRRKLLGGAAAAVLAASISEKAFAQTPNASRPVNLPKRGEYLLTGALVMTMDSQLGNVANGFVHVKDGTIVDVGPNISLPGVEVIGSDGMIVMPGLIDTHWHLWTAILRGMATSEQK